MPEWSKGCDLRSHGVKPRGFEPHYVHLIFFCRQFYWKQHMKDVVHIELIRKILGDEGVTTHILNSFL